MIRWWRDAWYRHKGSKYVHITDSDLENLCMEFLQDSQVCDDFAVQASKSALSSLVAGIGQQVPGIAVEAIPTTVGYPPARTPGQWR